MAKTKATKAGRRPHPLHQIIEKHNIPSVAKLGRAAGVGYMETWSVASGHRHYLGPRLRAALDTLGVDTAALESEMKKWAAEEAKFTLAELQAGNGG